MRWLVLLLIMLIGCTSPEAHQVREAKYEDYEEVDNDNLPLVPPSDLNYDEPYAPQGRHVFVMHADLGLLHRGGRRGVIQITSNHPIASHEAYTNEHGFKKGLVSWTKRYRTQTHIEVVFARRALPNKCYIHVDVVLGNGAKESVYFRLEADRLTQCPSPY